jgi:hypothetical protein
MTAFRSHRYKKHPVGFEKRRNPFSNINNK